MVLVRQSDTFTIELVGAVMRDSIKDLDSAVSQAIDSEFDVVSIDLSQSTTICSQGLGKLLLLHSALSSRHGTVQVTRSNDRIRRLLRLIQFGDLIPILDGD